jgi:hypothetical protein
VLERSEESAVTVIAKQSTSACQSIKAGIQFFAPLQSKPRTPMLTKYFICSAI